MKVLCVLMLGLTLLCQGVLRASFTDDFTRANNVDVGNGWVEGGVTYHFDPQLLMNQVSWTYLSSGDSIKSSWITRTFDAANDISVDLKWSTSNSFSQLANTYFEFSVESPNGQDRLTVRLTGASSTSVDRLGINVSYCKNGVVTESQTGVTGCIVYHTYRVTMNDQGKTRVYIDGLEEWVSTDAGLDACTKATITAKRYWANHKFWADNFAAINPWITFDIDNSGVVDFGDLEILAANYGESNKTRSEGDLNGDGKVDVGDLGILAAHYGQGVVSVAMDFNVDCEKLFGTKAANENDVDEADLAEDQTSASSACSLVGLPLVVGILFMSYFKMD